MSMHKHDQNQKGFVAILSVIFFVLLMSILTISFLRIMSDEQEQVVDSDLSKSALASAESGVEDAKRALVYCRSLPAGPDRIACYAALNNSNCPGMFGPTIQSTGGPNPLIGALSLDNTAGDGSIRVGNPANNQRYTCVTTNLNTPDVVGQASEELGEFIPLRSTSPFNRVTVYWHQIGVDGAVALPGAGNNNPRYSAWTSGVNRFVSGLRLQLVEFDSTKTLTQMNDSSSGMFLMPTSSSGPATYSTTNRLNLGAAITTGSVGDKRVEVTCGVAAVVAKGYSCAITIDVPNITPNATRKYFALVKSVYGAPHYKIEIAAGANAVDFNDVQPQIDSTGATGDVFRRVISRVSYQQSAFNTSNALESGVSICKDFFATDDDSQFSACPTGISTPSGGNAGVGDICLITPLACAGGGSGGTTPIWRSTVVNLSNNDPGTVAGCRWVITDYATGETVGTLNNVNCMYHDQFGYDFPPDPAYDGPPDPPKKRFDVSLTVTLNSGAQVVSDPYPFWLPRYPL